ncbi:MAG: 3-phosphoshikimate 1-carboxyvinyltransferase [Flavobacteriales bacterium]|nr:3-phosphoshikimate 1-carboxyvinyltransferase [Flavobacteriales bacterium]
MSHPLNYHPAKSRVEIDLPYSKSEANRLLIAQAISENAIQIEALSDAEDTRILADALKLDALEINVGMAGTAFRFLTAYFSIQEGKERILTGAKRMKERPIGILVDQLRVLGAEISYLEKEGYPPLKISGKQLKGGELKIDASVSSQYITALLLIAPKLSGGLRLKLTGQLVSLPYIDLTIALQQKLGVNSKRNASIISIEEGNYASKAPLQLERDWSSAAFFYQFVAFNRQALRLKGVTQDTAQGDKACSSIFKKLGVETVFDKEGAILKPVFIENPNELVLDLTETPDLIPSVAVCASQLINKTTIIGTQTLYIKESNRVEALKVELNKVGVEIIELDGTSIQIHKAVKINTVDLIQFSSYNDHRMAMCIGPLVCLYEKLSIDKLSVVEKSFPHFWREFNKLGVETV